MSSPPSDVLSGILASVRQSLASRREREPIAALARRAADAHPRRALFVDSLARRDRLNVIAECKRRSPSRGVLRRDYVPSALAAEYQGAGAAAISVLTEPEFFGGSLEHLAAVRAAVALPVLRKDFIVDEYQLFEARAAGADAVLLIVSALEPRLLAALARRAGELGLAALVEAHDPDGVESAVDAGAEIIGVNNRSLATLTVDVARSAALVDRIPEDVVAVAESGLQDHADLRRLRDAGYDAFLVGERLVSAERPGAALAALLGKVPR